MIISKSINVTENGIISFFFMAEEYFIVYMYHIFLTHSSVDGHLGSSQVLAIVNSAAINIGVHVFFTNCGFLWIDVRSGIAGSHGSPMFWFLRNFHTVLPRAVPIYFPTNSEGELLFLHIFSSIYYLYTLDDGHSD